MINFKDEKEISLLDAFNLTENDKKYFEEFQLVLERTPRTIPWVCKRLWIDEHLTDNAKCFAVFMLGRQFDELRKNQEGGDSARA
jgi:hypothetical protein